MTEAMGQRHQESVVSHSWQLQRLPHLKVESIANQDKRNVVQGVAVALAQLVCPDDQGVVQQRPIATRFRRFSHALGHLGQLFGKPLVDLVEFVD